MKQQDDHQHELQDDGKYMFLNKERRTDIGYIDMELTSTDDMTEDIVEEFARQLDEGNLVDELHVYKI